MKRVIPDESIKLAGFNNLTKCLSFNLYDFCFAYNEAERKAYADYVAEKFNAAKISEVLRGICHIIEAKVIAISDQDYDPWGASSLLLMSDIKGGGQSMHLDKSHICAHTYPDFTDGGKICTFRIDIDIATCGEISPLNALSFMFEKFESDVVVMDYVVRGFTRDTNGKRIYMDHELRTIQDYVPAEILKDYHCVDLALQSDNIWQTKMLRTNLDVQSYFLDPVDLESDQTKKSIERIKKEMRAVVYMWPE